jgi:hypothetical protein
MREIAKTGTAEAGMMGLMDRLAEAVVSTNERMLLLEKQSKNPRGSKDDRSGEPLLCLVP